uniref:Cytochrome P450 n=1 Tax=Streptomyces sp. WT6 TaxID=1486372 RepID=A0A023PXQ5_9ACTN|nr:hypothetical protein wt6.27c [Streptomyces sp. WT6]
MSKQWRVVTAPGRLPLIGHAHQLRHGLLGFLSSLPEHGDVVKIKIGPWAAQLVCHPDLVAKVLVDDRTFDKGGPIYDKFRDVIGNGLGTCPHASHRRKRRLLQPAFQRAKLAEYAPAMSAQIETATRSWTSGQVIDLTKQMHHITSRVLVGTLLSSNMAKAASTMEHSLDVIMQGVYRRMVIPVHILENLPLPSNRRFRNCRQHLREVVAESIDEYRRSEVDSGILAAIIDARDDNGAPLSDVEVQDELLTMLLAGIETVALTLTWALYQITLHPEVEKRLQAEADAVLQGRPARWEHLPDLKYTQRCIAETLRLVPPGWIFTRSVTQDTEIAGYRLKRGSLVAFSPYLVHRDPNYYPDPENFDPDRWTSEASGRRPRNSFIAFGGGARKCIGDNFAMHEASLALATIVAQWEMRTVSTRPIKPLARFSLTPGSLPMRLRSRNP